MHVYAHDAAGPREGSVGLDNERDESAMSERLQVAEGYLMQGEADAACDLLARLAADVEEYVSENCPSSDEEEWFSFGSDFERVAYRRVSGDRRTLHDVGEPIDRLYGDLGLALAQQGDRELAVTSLKRAIRWNPMDVDNYLRLSSLLRQAGDVEGSVQLAYETFERASDPAQLVQAYLIFANFFRELGRAGHGAACLRAARRLMPHSEGLASTIDQLRGSDLDPDSLDDAEEARLLDDARIPRGANIEVVIELLSCALTAELAGNEEARTSFVLRARGLSDDQTVEGILAELRKSDEEDAHGQG
ncbi:hypothetical protein HMPREF2826_03365 [Olsenella sp. HMSC062G07]|nr:hypothetical protein HMPREF2826_03365 [Olsenella sp. HMSC062G07]